MAEEIELGRIAGPFHSLPFHHLHIPPLTVREKSTPGKIRIIHNLSAPYDYSAINSNILENLKTVHYVEMSTILQAIHEIGKGAFIAKSDVKSAFRWFHLNQQITIYWVSLCLTNIILTAV